MNGKPLVLVRWYSTEEAAAALGVTARTVYGIINRGELKAHRFGRVIRINEDDLAACLAATVIKPGELTHLATPPSMVRNGAEARHAP